MFDYFQLCGVMSVESGGDTNHSNVFEIEYMDQLFFILSLRMLHHRPRLKYSIESEGEGYDFVISKQEIPSDLYKKRYENSIS